VGSYESDEVQRALVVAQRIRIAELELQLRDAGDLCNIAVQELRAILAGCGSTEEQMRASVPMLALQQHLADAIAGKPTPEPAHEPLPANVRPLRRSVMVVKRSTAHPVRDLLVGSTLPPRPQPTAHVEPCTADCYAGAQDLIDIDATYDSGEPQR
jgi:hypothetical protein